MLYFTDPTSAAHDTGRSRPASRSHLVVLFLGLVCATLFGTGTASAQAADVLDEFNGPTLNTSIWTYTNPLSDSPLTMTGTQVRIAVPGNRSHFTWSGINSAPRIMQAQANTDFELEVKFDSPVTLPFQMQGIRIEQNATNSITVQFDHTGTETELVYAHVVNNVIGTPVNIPLPGAPSYMRVLRRGSRFTISYSADGTNWVEAAITDRVMTVARVGAFIGNYSPGTPPAHTGLIDYFYKRGVAPSITTQPQSLTVTQPGSATFSVTAAGTPALTYRWRRNGVNIPSATAATYTLSPTALADSGAQLDVVVTNSRGSVTSDPATLTVLQPSAPPVAAGDTYTVSSGGSINTAVDGLPGVLANDHDPDGGFLSAALVEGVINGALTLNSDGSFDYVHSGNDLGSQQLFPGALDSLMEYGVATAIDGDTLLVGSNSTERGRNLAGAVYVFVRNGARWTLQTKLVPPDAVAIHFFGWALGISGNTIVVGAAGDNFAGTYSGAAYVYVRNGTTWTQQAKLRPTDTRAGDEFGTAVAIHNNTVIVGGHYHDDGAVDAGAAFVFVRNGTTWTQQAELLPSQPLTRGWFGFSVAVYGDRAIVGAIYDTTNGVDAGAAHVFVRNGTIWSEQAKLLAFDGVAGDTFGFSVALGANRAVVGATAFQGTAGVMGSVYVFDWDGVSWIAGQKLTSPDAPGAGVYGFGTAVALDGDTILVGAQGDDVQGTNAGAAYLFQVDGSTWTLQRKITGPAPSAGTEFGVAVALQGNYAVFGANTQKWQLIPDRANGAAFVYQLGGSLTDSFTYVANDGGANSNTATVTITLQP